MSGAARSLQTRGWRVAGRVQGVGFRWFVAESARRAGLAGEVRNLRDGRVEVRARGDEPSLGRLEQALRSGPPAARVERLERFETDEESEFDGFEIRT